LTPRGRLFISYARADAPVALHVYRGLAAAGRDVWLDVVHLAPGVDWWDGARRAIDHCVGVLFLVSSESSRSASCRRELAYGLGRGKPLWLLGVESSSTDDTFRRQGSSIHSAAAKDV